MSSVRRHTGRLSIQVDDAMIMLQVTLLVLFLTASFQREVAALRSCEGLRRGILVDTERRDRGLHRYPDQRREFWRVLGQMW